MAGRSGRGRSWARPSSDGSQQVDLFSVRPAESIVHRVQATGAWPDTERFPLNLSDRKVADQVLADLRGATDPLVVAGFASLMEVVDLIAQRVTSGAATTGVVRVLLGAEPLPTARQDFTLRGHTFSNEVRAYWLERGVSLKASTRIIVAMDAIRAGRVSVRALDGRWRLHAKVFVGDDAVTLGSSNLTSVGLRAQFEANVRYLRHDRDAGERARAADAVTIAENYWAAGEPYDDEIIELLEALLRLVGWREALARACAVLLEGEWAERYLTGQVLAGDTRLWPSQVAGIAQAMWVVETSGSVLVADTTGSGKTRMGAHLVRAMRERLWASGLTRNDLTLVVCPPGVLPTWEHESVSCGLGPQILSSGALSRLRNVEGDVRQQLLRSAQILAVDEAHNYLNDSNRTEQLRDNRADHVVLFTATPINRNAADLVAMAMLLGADNLDDDSLAALERIGRLRGALDLTPDEVDTLRAGLQRFMVRRTKATLNAMVDADPEAYRSPDGRVARFPAHVPHTYATGETTADERIAAEIARVASELTGVARLERVLKVPRALAAQGLTGARYLEWRLRSSAALAAHQVLASMRSSRAALVQHLVGTGEAVRRLGLGTAPRVNSGDVISTCAHQASLRPPRSELGCELPSWLSDADAFAAACLEEQDRYRRILDLSGELTDARERTKAQLLADLAERADLVLAFDRHPISLHAIDALLVGRGIDTVIATGSTQDEKKRVTRLFERRSTHRGIALCSDALAEGLNLQGASVVVHLDLPTTVRVAEQRVGRIDRMDSPHDRIEAWWPDDGPAFVTRANERLAERLETVSALIGSNLPLPAAFTSASAVDVHEVIAEVEAASDRRWDGLADAFEPVRSLVGGERGLVSTVTYDEVRLAGGAVRSRMACVRSTGGPWALFALSAGAARAPRWVWLDDRHPSPITDLEEVVGQLRARLVEPVEDLEVGAAESAVVDGLLGRLAGVEQLLLPRQRQRALDQMRHVLEAWASAAAAAGDEDRAARWRAVASAAHLDPDAAAQPDLWSVSDVWLDLTRQRVVQLQRDRRGRRGRRPFLLSDATPALVADPLPLVEVEERFRDVPLAPAVDTQIAAALVGVPSR